MRGDNRTGPDVMLSAVPGLPPGAAVRVSSTSTSTKPSRRGWRESSTAAALRQMKIWIGAGVAVLAIAAGGALLWREAPEDSDPLTGINTTNRRVEARLTQFSYGTFRGAATSETEDDLRARVAIGKLEAEVAGSRTGGNLHRMALAH